jgi:hypothetical protein
MFQIALGMDEELYRKLADDRTLGWKLDLFKAFLLTKLRTKRDRQRFTEIMDELKGLHQERNTAVHGQWTPGGTGLRLGELFGLGPFRPAVARHARRGSKKVSELRVERLEGIAARLEHGRGALTHFFLEYLRAKWRRTRKRAASKGREAP